MKIAPFNYEPMTRECADSLAEAYRKRGKRVDISLDPFDPKLWVVTVVLPISEKPPRSSGQYQQPVWRLIK